MSNKVLIAQQTTARFNADVAEVQNVSNARVLRLNTRNTPTSILPTSVPSFGQNGNGTKNPADNVLLDVYSFTSVYQESNYNVSGYSRIDSDTLQFDVMQDLENLGYINGKFLVQYRLLRNLLGTGDGEKLSIIEVSADRLEARVVPLQSNSQDYLGFKNFFQKDFLLKPKAETLPALRLFLDSQNTYEVFDYIQDKVTVPFAPYSIILKFNNPLPPNVIVGSSGFLAQQLTSSDIEEVIVLPKRSQPGTVLLKGPNFDATNRFKSQASTPFKNYTQLSGSGNFETNLIAATLSSSLIESIPLNVDYRSFENYIFFGSAAERLYNYQYKIKLLESYNARLSQLTTDLSGLPSSSVTGSNLFLNNIASTQNKINSLVGGFDSYERYLYYESSSYESSSYGEFYPTTWPKQTATKPYTLYSYTSSQAEEWFEGIIASASLYDEQNQNSLRRTIPEHIQEDESNDGYVLFVNMIGHYFDIIYAYVKQLNYTHDRQESIFEGFAKDLVYNIGESLGIDFDSGTKLDDIWNYVLGVDSTGSYAYTNQISLKDKQLELWKRLINNLPYLLKTKGTERGLRALVNIYGIPSTMLRIREYGGPESDYDSVSDYTYDRYFYALNIGSLTSVTPIYYGTGSYGSGSYGSGSQYYSRIAIPWIDLDETSRKPDSVELRFKAVSGSNRTQVLFDKPNDFAVKLDYTNATSSIQFVLSGSSGWATASVEAPVFDGNFWNLLLRRTVDTDDISYNNQYDIIIEQVKYDKITQKYTASLSIDASTSSSYNQAYINSDTIYIGSSDSSSYFSGSVQEFRYWATILDDEAYNQHTLAPTSFVGNNPNNYLINASSFATLAARFCFGSDNKRLQPFLTTASLFSPTASLSQHPNQDTNLSISASYQNFSSNYSISESYTPIVESHTLYWPDLSGNRQISNKIRLQDNSLIKPILDRNVRLEISSNETYPIDSPRLGLYFSPQDEVNQDIAEQFGSSNIDDLIGDPRDLEKDNYPSLNLIQVEYNKKYKGRNRVGDYLNRVKQVDDSVFRLAKQLVPLRANFQTGVVIEPTLIQRSKLPMNQPTWENNTYSSSIDVGESYVNVSSTVADASGDSIAEGYYIFDTTITTPVVAPTASFDQITASIDTNIVNISMYANPYNNEQTCTALVGGDFPEGYIDLFDEGSSQYTFIETVYSGSVWTSSLNPYWRRDPLQPVILDARFSEIFNTTSNGVDLYAGAGYMSTYPTQSGTTDLAGNPIITTLGASFFSVETLSPAGYWQLDGTYLNFTTYVSTGPFTGSAFFLAFSQNQSTAYDIHISSDFSNGIVDRASLSVAANNTTPYVQGSQLLYDNLQASPGLVIIENVQISGSLLQILVECNGPGSSGPGLEYIKVIPRNLKPRIQDYHFLYEGRVRQLYDGTRQTSQDYNIDSDDTVDKGPVIIVQTVNPNTLNQSSNISLGNSNLDVD